MSDIINVGRIALNGDPSPVRSVLKSIHIQGPAGGQQAREGTQLVAICGLYIYVTAAAASREGRLLFCFSQYQ